MSTDLAKPVTGLVTRSFGSTPIVEFSFNGRQCWLLSSIEKAMEYAEGVLGGLMRDEWSSEFRVGHHFDVVQGAGLRELKRSLTGSNLVSANSKAVTVLYTEGVDLAVLKTEKPIGRAVRAFLVDNVMQPLRETGRVDLREPTPAEALRIRELEAREREIALRQAELLGSTLGRLRDLKMLSAENEVAWSLTVAEMGTGRSLIDLRPPAKTVAWVTPTEIANRVGLSAQAIGKIIAAIGVRESMPGEWESYTTVAPGESRVVHCFRYTPKAAAVIEAAAIESKSKRGAQ